MHQDLSKKVQFFKDLQQQFYEEISASEEAKEYFSKYYPSSVDSFIKSYASKKVHLAQCYEYYERLYSEKETANLDYQKKAENMLIAILQKKLFNIQLQWRAGKIDIDEMMKELGISKYKSKEEIRADYEKDEIAKIYRKAILDGRKLNGEPEDFNY